MLTEEDCIKAVCHYETYQKKIWDATFQIIGIMPEGGLVLQAHIHTSGGRRCDQFLYSTESAHDDSYLAGLGWGSEAPVDISPWPVPVVDPLEEINAMQEELANAS